MIKKSRGKVSWLEFELLQETKVKHGVFLRGSEEVNMQEFLQVKQIAQLKQVHGKEVVSITSSDISHTADGGLTSQKELALQIFHADCQAAIFYDPVEEVIACVHAGWRGLVAEIYTESIAKLERDFNVKRENLIVCIGPSLEPEHSEFIHYEKEFPETFWPFQIKPHYFDLWAIAKRELKNAGILERHIEIAKIGTYKNKEEFHSYRRDKTTLRNRTLCLLNNRTLVTL